MITPTWLTLPEPTSLIQRYFSFLELDGRLLQQIPNYDVYAITSYIWCTKGKKPVPPKREGLRYYHREVEISGMALAQGGRFPESRKDISLLFQKEIRKIRNEIEELIKKELGDRNIWVYTSTPPYELKLLKRI